VGSQLVFKVVDTESWISQPGNGSQDFSGE